MKMALSLVDSLTADFDPKRYHDDYREKVLELIHKKAEGKEIVTRATTDEEAPKSGHDLVAALEASLAQAKGAAKTNGRAHPRPALHTARNGRVAAHTRRRSA